MKRKATTTKPKTRTPEVIKPLAREDAIDRATLALEYLSTAIRALSRGLPINHRAVAEPVQWAAACFSEFTGRVDPGAGEIIRRLEEEKEALLERLEAAEIA